jgi:hypothetical protein
MHARTHPRNYAQAQRAQNRYTPYKTRSQEGREREVLRPHKHGFPGEGIDNVVEGAVERLRQAGGFGSAHSRNDREVGE